MQIWPNSNTDRTLDVVFSRFKQFFVHNNPEAEAQSSYAHAALNYNTEREYARNSSGFCLRVIVNEKFLNLEMTSISVLSVLLLIYGVYIIIV